MNNTLKTFNSARTSCFKQLVLALFFFIGSTLYSQQTFNIGTKIHGYYVQNADIIPYEDGYVFAGKMADTTYNYWGYYLGSLELDGSTRTINLFSQPERHILIPFARTLPLKDSTFLTIGWAWNPNRLYLIKFNSQGDTILTKELYPAINDQISSSGITNSIQCKDGGFAVTGTQKWIGLEEYGPELVIYRFDSLLNLTWKRVFGEGYRKQQGSDLLELDNGNIIVFGRDYYGPDPNTGDSIVHALYFIEVDQSGNLIREVINNNEIRSGSYEVLLAPDGGYILCSSRYIDKKYSNGSPGNLLAYPSVVKVDQDFEYVWETELDDLVETSFTILYSLTPSGDGQGFVTTGVTADTTGGIPTVYGLISKLDWDGKILWTRYYIPEKDPYPYCTYCNMLTSIELCPDGGYIAGGLLGYQPDDGWPYRQQAWFLKLDEYGCLVPGCQLPSSTEDILENENGTSILPYPNPASDQLNIHVVPPKDIRKWELQILDMQGKQVFSQAYTMSDLTIMLNTTDWPTGQYIARISAEGRFLGSAKVVIVR